MANKNLTSAKRAKNDEFYTQFYDIEKEVNAYIEFNPNVFRGKTIFLPCDDPEWSNFTKYFAQNFAKFGLKKLISTSFANDSKTYKTNYQPTLFEMDDSKFDTVKTHANGKIFTLEPTDLNGDGKVDIDDLKFDYLEGDGDFRSAEIRKIRDESDIIVTNPPFSLFREFLAWIISADKKFLIIGNMNAITYKEVFPLIKENRMWLGPPFSSGNAYFATPTDTTKYANGVYDETTNLVKFRNVVWMTNLDHGRRHQPLALMTMADNEKFAKMTYPKYENYDAIEVSKTLAIPSDYAGVMGVPISFLDKYDPAQFEIISFRYGNDNKDLRLQNEKQPYFRILIKNRSFINE